jgi:hypothetical protein
VKDLAFKINLLDRDLERIVVGPDDDGGGDDGGCDGSDDGSLDGFGSDSDSDSDGGSPPTATTFA